uniref:Uncharacterized protein n=1 Tax=Eutreptiella gymnastica TaxID=73025 RepID=A0A7S1IQD0_9EUGL|mmetsp:Transcript_3418/g.5879  ORF Transcript_3418/g.5879 Transcript_3418/m.5879 type:complete len:114 (+) Transcript_3418:430-771(+)
MPWHPTPHACELEGEPPTGDLQDEEPRTFVDAFLGIFWGGGKQYHSHAAVDCRAGSQDSGQSNSSFYGGWGEGSALHARDPPRHEMSPHETETCHIWQSLCMKSRLQGKIVPN